MENKSLFIWEVFLAFPQKTWKGRSGLIAGSQGLDSGLRCQTLQPEVVSFLGDVSSDQVTQRLQGLPEASHGKASQPHLPLFHVLVSAFSASTFLLHGVSSDHCVCA